MAERELAILISAKNLASGAIGAVKRDVQGLDRAAAGVGSKSGLLSTKLGGLETRAKGIGGAFSKASTAALGFGRSLGPLLGVGGALGATALLGDTIRKTNEFGVSVMKIKQVTGLATPAASSLVDALDKYGVSGDAAVKSFTKLNVNVVKATASKKAQAKFEEQYGIKLRDNSGHVKDANQLLLDSITFFNGNASAAQKSATMQALWGKSWQQFLPVFAIGTAKFQDEQKNSIKLTDENMMSIENNRKAMIDFADAFGDAQVKVGANIMPVITEGLRGLGTWIDQHGDDIANAAKDAAQLARSAGAGIMQALGAVKAGWDAIPPPLRDLLIKGVVANKVLKMTLGIDVIDMARKTLFNAVMGIRAGIVNVNGPVRGGGVAGAAGGGGLAGKLGTGLAVAGAVAGVIGVIETWQDQNKQSTEQANAIQQTQLDWLKQQPKREDLVTGLNGIRQGIKDIESNPLNVLVQGDALNKLREMETAQTAALAKLDAVAQAVRDKEFTAQVMSVTSPQAVHNLRPTASPRPTLKPFRPRASDFTDVPDSRRRAHARGLLGMARGATDLGIAGEAGDEAVAIVRRPRRLAGWRGDAGTGGLRLTIQTTVSHRENATARVYHSRYGPTASEAGAM